MNSVAIVNWEDVDFQKRVVYSLAKQGYVLSEDYTDVGVRTQVWIKEAGNNLNGRVLSTTAQRS
jgi:hypothetical protein